MPGLVHSSEQHTVAYLTLPCPLRPSWHHPDVFLRCKYLSLCDEYHISGNQNTNNLISICQSESRLLTGWLLLQAMQPLPLLQPQLPYDLTTPPGGYQQPQPLYLQQRGPSQQLQGGFPGMPGQTGQFMDNQQQSGAQQQMADDAFGGVPFVQQQYTLQPPGSEAYN